jgi:hypothetical protein
MLSHTTPISRPFPIPTRKYLCNIRLEKTAPETFQPQPD